MTPWDEEQELKDRRCERIEEYLHRLGEEVHSMRAIIMINTVMVAILSATFVSAAGRLVAKALGE